MALNTNYKKNTQNLLGSRFLILVLMGLPFFFRQNVYSFVITYRVGQERLADTQLDAYFERYILTHPDVFDRSFDNIDKIIHVSLKITADALTFKGESTLKTDPLSTLRLGETNSEGYAAFFNAVCSYLIKRFHLASQYECRQYIAERLKNGVNLHDAVQSPYDGSSPFNKNRDIVAIVDSQTGERVFVDPTIYDQFNIVYINVAGATASPSMQSKSARISRTQRGIFQKP
jgi:hypothetical protein